jgi:hypothetical protein
MRRRHAIGHPAEPQCLQVRPSSRIVPRLHQGHLHHMSVPLSMQQLEASDTLAISSKKGSHRLLRELRVKCLYIPIITQIIDASHLSRQHCLLRPREVLCFDRRGPVCPPTGPRFVFLSCSIAPEHSRHERVDTCNFTGVCLGAYKFVRHHSPVGALRCGH